MRSTLGQQAARPGGVDVDEGGPGIAQRPRERRIHLGARAHLAQVVDALVGGVVGADGYERAFRNDRRDDAGSCKLRAAVRVDEDRAWRPVDAAGPGQVVGAEQHRLPGRPEPQAVAARGAAAALRRDAPDRVAVVVQAGAAEALGGVGRDRDAVECGHGLVLLVPDPGRSAAGTHPVPCCGILSTVPPWGGMGSMPLVLAGVVQVSNVICKTCNWGQICLCSVVATGGKDGRTVAGAGSRGAAALRALPGLGAHPACGRDQSRPAPDRHDLRRGV